MTKLQFRILYREFLFRLIDLDLLASHAQGDSHRLLGQFAGLLIFFSAALGLGAMLLDPVALPAAAALLLTWSMEHFLIATTMLVVGLFAVLSWDSTFPNRRDVLVLAPLPVRATTLFLAKVAAVGAGLGLTVASLHVIIGIAWPLLLALPLTHGPLDLIVSPALYRALAAYWFTMFASGAFIFCCVLGVQGLAAQLLRRRQFLRVSSFLQMAAFCLFVAGYFLEPSLASPQALAAPGNQRVLAWLPSYWFLGLFHQLNGSLHSAMAPLAWRAWMALACAMIGAGSAFLLSYFRTLRKIVEEPDILPGTRGGNWLPRFGTSLQTAIVQFSIRTLLRSRQHRVILSFYLGVGFALDVLFLKSPPPHQGGLIVADPWHHLSLPLLYSTIVMLCLAVAGTRAVFALPLELRANWVFRILPLAGTPQCLIAARRALVVLALVPIWIASAALFFSMWPWRPAAGHLVVLGLLGLILADICVYGFRKLPFTCSYLPGKSRVHLAFLLYLILLNLLILWGAQTELDALTSPRRYGVMIAVLATLAAMLRYRVAGLAKSEESVLQFEESETPAIFALDLHRDGVTTDEGVTLRGVSPFGLRSCFPAGPMRRQPHLLTAPYRAVGSTAPLAQPPRLLNAAPLHAARDRA